LHLQVDTTILGLDPERAKELPYIASMGIYVFSKDVMLRLLRENFPAANDFGSEVIPGATEIGMRVCYAVEHFFGFLNHFKVYCCSLYGFCISVNLKIVVTSFLEAFYFSY